MSRFGGKAVSAVANPSTRGIKPLAATTCRSMIDGADRNERRRSPVVVAASDRPPGRAEDPQDCANQDQHDSDGPQDGNVEEEAEEEENNADGDHRSVVPVRSDSKPRAAMQVTV